MGDQVAVTGVAEVVRALDGIARDLDDLPAVEDLAQLGARAASRAANRQTGAMAAGITGRADRGHGVVTAGLVYSGVQNYGWTARSIPAHGFMQAGDAAIDAAATPRLETDINRSIRQRGL